MNQKIKELFDDTNVVARIQNKLPKTWNKSQRR